MQHKEKIMILPLCLIRSYSIRTTSQPLPIIIYKLSLTIHVITLYQILLLEVIFIKINVNNKHNNE